MALKCSICVGQMLCNLWSPIRVTHRDRNHFEVFSLDERVKSWELFISGLTYLCSNVKWYHSTRIFTVLLVNQTSWTRLWVYHCNYAWIVQYLGPACSNTAEKWKTLLHI